MNINDSVSWDDVAQLTTDHAAKLEAAAISPATAAKFNIRSATTVDQLPEWARERRWAEAALPAIIYPWTDPQGRVFEQIRPDEVLVWEGEEHKYLFPSGVGAVLNTIVPATDDTQTVLIVEGTKQGFAAGSWAPEKTAVYAIGGCRNWSSDGLPNYGDLMVVEDKTVVIALDADTATNLDVYNAGLKLAEVCDLAGAKKVTHMRTGAMGSNGLDDVLGSLPPTARTKTLGRFLDKGKPKPADAKPAAKSKGNGTVPEASPNRPRIFMDQDRLDVINRLTGALIGRWNATKMFDHGGVLSILAHERRQGQNSVPVLMALDKKTMTDLVQETVQTVRQGQQGELVFCYPEVASLDAIFSRYRMFAPIDRIARMPFVRHDGSICQTPGYDEASFTYLALDPAMQAIQVPEDPSGEDIAWAVKLIREEWLFDFFNNMPDEASRTNAVALALTPFVRGLMPVVPMAVIDGLQMGVGKNLLADVAVAIPATGDGVEPMNWDQQDDQENRKQITSAFKDGADIYVFDEAHKLHGASLARAITAATWKDRNLGHSQMLGFRNQVTWVALGNNVDVGGDIIRRVYRIALRPDVPNPQDRRASDFRIPDIRRWTLTHRTEIITAMLILIRSWFSAGQPSPKDTSFGSFEEWERVVGGVLAHAGFEGFLANTQEWRREANDDKTYWVSHMYWLWETFGEESFSCRQVREALGRSNDRVCPPHMTDLTGDTEEYARKLGNAYRTFNGQHFESIKFVRLDQKAHGNSRKYRVYGPDMGGNNDSAGNGPVPGDSGPVGGGDGGSGGTKNSQTPEKEIVSSDARTHTYDSLSGRERDSGPSIPPTPPTDSGDTVETALIAHEPIISGTDQPSLFETLEQQEVVEGEVVDLATWSTEGEIDLLPGTVVFDIESTSEKLWPLRTGFIRITGVQQGKVIRVLDDAEEVAQLLREATMIVGHNIMGFDLLAFALHHGVDIHHLAAEGRIIDTMINEVLVNPPEARTKQGQIMRAVGLDALGAKKELGGKSHKLSDLAKKHGGFDKIPTNDKEYATYCAQDVNLTAKLGRTQGAPSDYAKREMRVAAMAAQIRINGFRVDVELNHQRVVEGEQLRGQRLEELADKYKLPLVDAKGVPYKAPHQAKAGKLAIAQAFADLGVTLGKTAKSGDPAFGKEAREALIEEYAEDEKVMDLIDTVSSLLGIRTVFGTVERCLVGDRVHPDITMFQSSGRWSITEPGLTVMGKRGGKHKEREIFIPEPGHVIIAADLSQVDARVVAAFSQDPNYFQLFEDGRDLHAEVALAALGDASLREEAKALGHGWNYGMGVPSLTRKIGDENIAREFDRGMRERYPDLVRWKSETAARADSGQLLDNGFGRKLRTTPGKGFTQGPALMGQSAARDILMEGLLRMPAEFRPYLRAVIHDEIVMSVPEDQVERISEQVVEAMSFSWAPAGAEMAIEIKSECSKPGANWGAVYAK